MKAGFKAAIETFSLEIDAHQLQQFNAVITFLRPVTYCIPLK